MKSKEPFTVYRVVSWDNVIRTKQVFGETEKFWIEEGGRREAKVSEWASWFRSQSEAITHAKEVAEIDVAIQEAKLNQSRERLAWLNGLEGK